MPAGSPSLPTRQRLLTSAISLFRKQGYRATTVGQIEQGAGLSPRAGSFYGHFQSKEEIFEAALEVWIADVRAFSDEFFSLLPLEDLRSELTVIARGALRLLAHQRELFRFLARDGSDFPELVATVHRELVIKGYEELDAWFRARLKQQGLPARGSRSMAAVALSALVHYREDEAVFGSPPGDVGEEDFIRTWVSVWEHWFNR